MTEMEWAIRCLSRGIRSQSAASFIQELKEMLEPAILAGEHPDPDDLDEIVNRPLA